MLLAVGPNRSGDLGLVVPVVRVGEGPTGGPNACTSFGCGGLNLPEDAAVWAQDSACGGM